MLGKSVLAFLATAERLQSGRLYLWTFTFAEALPYEELRVRWNKLLTYLRRRLPLWSGVRVYEVHPGRWGEFSHGLHVHAVCTRFHNIDLIRHCATLAGWGRIHVLRIPRSRVDYLAKYLKKKRPPTLKGWRLWAAFGDTPRSRCSDWVCESLRATLFRLGHATGTFAGLTWGEKQVLVNRWHWQKIAGELLWQPFTRAAAAYAFKPGKISGRSKYGEGEWRVLTSGTREDFEARRRARRPPVWKTPLLPWGFTPRPRPDCTGTDCFNSVWGPDLRRADLVANRAYSRALASSDNPF